MSEAVTPPSGEDNQRLAAYHEECREKYDDKAREALAKKGIGYALPDGSFPTDDASDVEKAIHAVGRGGADHDHIRVHIIAAAKRLGVENLIPDDWRPDGSIKEPEQKSRRRKGARQRAIPLVPELRFYRTSDLEYREDSSTGLVWITGTPIVYNTPYTVSDMFGEFTERMNPSVGEDAMTRGFDVRLLENHKGLPFARTKPAQGKSPTLLLEHAPGVGVRMRAGVDPDAPRVQDLLSAIERGDAGEMSVGFMVGDDQWSDDYLEREIFRFAEWLDVSVVTFAASPTTDVEMARSRKMLMDVRAGKVLSDDNLGKVKDAAKLMHGLLQSAGVDPNSLLEPNEPNETETTAEQDGSDGGTEGSGVAPDSVNQDGSGVFRGEHDPGEKIRTLTMREKRASYNDLEQAAESALQVKYGDDDGDIDLWVCDMSDEWVIFDSYVSPPGMGYWQISYHMDGDTVVIDGDPVQVVRKTVYEPGASESGPEQRAATRNRAKRASYRALIRGPESLADSRAISRTSEPEQGS